MSIRTRATVAASLVALGLAPVACKKPEPAAPAPAPAAQPAPAAPADAPKTASVSGKSAPDCVGPFAPSDAPTRRQIGALTFLDAGSSLTLAQDDADDAITFGVIANLKEATGENLYNLRRYIEFFTAQQAEAILVAGDSGETRDDIERVLAPLAETGLPLFVIPGSREARSSYHAAIDSLSERHSNVVDMTKVRLVNFDAASLVSLPGYYDKRFMTAGDDRCQYFKEDVEALADIARAATRPVVLLSHAEFLGRGKEAIDAFSDGNAGDANLTALLRSAPVPFGVFANIQEAGGRASDLDSNLVRENDPKPQLFVNTGMADSTAWPLNDATTSHGMVTAITVKGTLASYRAYRAPQLTDAERAEAAQLVPAASALVAP